MQLLKIIKKTNSKIDQARTILSVFCLMSDIKLSYKELTILSYFMVYGAEDARTLILKSGLTTPASLENIKSKLRGFGLLKKDPISKLPVLNDRLNFKFDSEVGVLIKIDNK